MLTLHQKRRRGQSLVIIALSATVLFGIIALGLDAGRLYFQRRDVQNAADAGALAGAQDLIPTGVGISGNPALARCDAAIYAFKLFGDTPQHTCGDPFWSQGTTVTESAVNDTAPTVTVTTPSRNNANELKAEVLYNVQTTFASVMGFTSSQVYAVAYAHGGFYNKQYTVFGFDATGSGNSVNYDQVGYAQIDNGNNGSDCSKVDAQKGKLVSNAKFHVPNPNLQYLNLNGQFYYAQASDTHAVILYWFQPVQPTTSNIDPAPNYEAPTTTALMPVDPDWTPLAGGGRDYHPGIYRTKSITISSGTAQFENGLYFFEGQNFTITGGSVGNTINAVPRYNAKGEGRTNLPAAADGTTGVEFVFSGNSSFTATGPASIFFVAPSWVPSGTDSIAFFIKSTDTVSGPNGQTWTEQVDGTQGGKFEVWGTVFNQDVNGSHGTVAVLTAVESNGLQGALNGPPSHYAINGELISPQVDLNGGGLATSGALSSACYTQQPAGLLVQYNPDFAPHFHGFSYLVK